MSDDTTDISIHTSPKGGDNGDWDYTHRPPVFQSTPPRREVTRLGQLTAHRHEYFNPHLPEGR
ncbi:hypothetical protein PG2022B_1699 [Bifidobacterium animalis subsp. animalis]|nr:hypothetical protein PG2022B_1699 [Bifidobacterium animalis subsp. animalis]